MDDFDFGGGYSLWSDTPDMGSAWDFGSIGGGNDYAAQPYNFGGGGTSGFDTSWLNAYTQPQQQGGIYSGSSLPFAQQSGGMAPQQQPQQPQANPWISGLLGAAGPLTGLIGALASGGKGPTTGPQPTTAQKANMATGNQLAQQGAQGQLPAQQMQMSLLRALAGGQGLPSGYASLVEQAFQPQMGDLYTQAAQMGRRKGFYDAPATSPPGGAILGPGLANIQGQMAAAKLGLMHSLPQLFNQPAQTQGSFAQNYLQAAQGAPMQQGSQQPMAPLIANNVGNILSGAAQGYNAGTQQNQQQQTLNSLLEALQGNQPRIGGLSYT